MIEPQHWTKALLDQHSTDWRQFIDFRAARLENGVRVIEAYNSSGLHLTLLPDHGCDIWQASYKGLPLTWLSQGSPKPADYGQSWLQQFNGGLLTSCGLTHVGPPETDPQSGSFRDLHGPYSRIPSRIRAIEQHIDEEGRIVLELKAEIVQSALFGEQLLLERSYHMTLGLPVISLHDRIINRGDEPSPLMLLYHINLGFPLVHEGARLHIASEVQPRDDIAAAGLSTWAHYEAAQRGYPEQVFFHHCKSSSHEAQALLEADTIGLRVSWDTAALPYFTQWKNTREGIYVAGLEPGNCIPEGQNSAAEQGRLQWLSPGESFESSLRIEMLQGAHMRNAIDEIAQSTTHGKLTPNCYLKPDTKESGTL